MIITDRWTSPNSSELRSNALKFSRFRMALCGSAGYICHGFAGFLMGLRGRNVMEFAPSGRLPLWPSELCPAFPRLCQGFPRLCRAYAGLMPLFPWALP